MNTIDAADINRATRVRRAEARVIGAAVAYEQCKGRDPKVTMDLVHAAREVIAAREHLPKPTDAQRLDVDSNHEQAVSCASTLLDPERDHVDTGTALDLAESFLALDKAIKTGGPLPMEWDR